MIDLNNYSVMIFETLYQLVRDNSIMLNKL